MEDTDFAAKTSAFLSWLVEIGVHMSPKMELCDLRGEGRGRGVGKLTSSFKRIIHTFLVTNP
jgi:hypothetical protein